MKILFIHNKYGVISGEEVMLQKILALLQHYNHETYNFFKNSASISGTSFGKTHAFFNGIYSRGSRIEIESLLSDLQPDIVQIQNLYPLISPAVLPVIKARAIPIVMRVSNYRLVCPNGLLLCRGEVCEKCRNGREIWCLLKNCENQIGKSAGYALRSWFARKRRYYLDNVDYFYAQTAFQKDVLMEDGIDENRIAVIPNMVDDINGLELDSDDGYIAYAGRVSPEKGIAVFLAAADIYSELSFKVAGVHNRMPELGCSAGRKSVFTGYLEKKELEVFYRKSRMFVMPSIWYEGFPSVVIEAMLNGKPVVCSRIGGLPEIVEDGVTGLLFEPGNAQDLAEKIRYLYCRPELCREMGAAGRKKVLEEYSPQKYYERLMGVYDKVLERTV